MVSSADIYVPLMLFVADSAATYAAEAQEAS